MKEPEEVKTFPEFLISKHFFLIFENFLMKYKQQQKQNKPFSHFNVQSLLRGACVGATQGESDLHVTPAHSDKESKGDGGTIGGVTSDMGHKVADGHHHKGPPLRQGQGSSHFNLTLLQGLSCSARTSHQEAQLGADDLGNIEGQFKAQEVEWDEWGSPGPAVGNGRIVAHQRARMEVHRPDGEGAQGGRELLAVVTKPGLDYTINNRDHWQERLPSDAEGFRAALETNSPKVREPGRDRLHQLETAEGRRQEVEGRRPERVILQGRIRRDRRRRLPKNPGKEPGMSQIAGAELGGPLSNGRTGEAAPTRELQAQVEQDRDDGGDVGSFSPLKVSVDYVECEDGERGTPRTAGHSDGLSQDGREAGPVPGQAISSPPGTSHRTTAETYQRVNRLPPPDAEGGLGEDDLIHRDHASPDDPGDGDLMAGRGPRGPLLPTPDSGEPVGSQGAGDGNPSPLIRGTKDRLHFIQLNMHHARLPTYELFPSIADNMLACIQEPWIVKGHPKGLLQHVRAIYASDPKAAIICHKDMNIVPLPHLTTPLMATGMLHTTQGNRTLPKILISSWYWPPQMPMPTEFGTLVDHLRTMGTAFIILGDVNAHSTWWGHADTDNRGRELEEIIMALRATILNKGNVQTFQGARGSSAIDISLVSSDVATLAPQWQCGRRVSHSDHLRIDIYLRLEVQVCRRSLRDINKTDWPRFGHLVEAGIKLENPTRWTAAMVDSQANLFNRTVRLAWEEATPLRMAAVTRHYTWWTDELQAKKKEVRQAQHRVRDGAGEEDYKRLRMEYTKLLRTTKKSKWQDYTSASKTVPLQAKLMTMIHHAPRQMIGALRDGDGYTDNEDDSLAILLREHFPEHIAYREGVEDGPPTMLRDIPWLTVDLLKKAIHKFKKGKRAGPDGIRPEMLKHLPEVALMQLLQLYQMVITSGYTPWCWKEAQVIFLPKPNKPDYTDTASVL